MASDIETTSVSFLLRLKNPADGDAWRQFEGCYGPLLRRWLLGRGVSPDDADDVLQEIMQVALVELPAFEHNGRAGALRNWLKQVTANRLRTFWRRKNRQANARGGSDYAHIAEQLTDPNSQLSRLWDDEYRHAICTRLLELVQDKFDAQTLEAFRRVVILEEAAVDVARDMGKSPNAVRIAQSRVLRQMRELGAELLD